MHISKRIISVYIIASFLLVSCTGEDGAIGPSGFNSLIQTVIEPVGVNCEYGGLKVESGIDIDGDGILEPKEILKTDYVCSIAGNNSLVNTEDEPAGANCVNGGIKIETGIDIDGDGTLDDEETQVTRFLCNGIDGERDETIFIHLTANISNNKPVPYTYAANIPFFDIRDYSQIDSVVFAVKDISTTDEFSNDIDGEGTFELYDMTNDQVVVNSSITSDDIPKNSFVTSGNLMSTLPQEQIKLGIQITSGGSFKSSTGNIYLILFRKD